MSTNSKVTSKRVSTIAAKILNSNSSSQTAKKLAGSALSQVQKGSQIEDLASKVLSGTKYSHETKIIAGSVLSQANKER